MNKLEERCPAIRRLRRGKVAVCEIPAILPGHRSWVGVYPLHPYPKYQHKGDYRVRVFEVDEKHLINANDVWEGVMVKREDAFIFGEEDLVAKVSEFTDPRSLADSWGSDYPI